MANTPKGLHEVEQFQSCARIAGDKDSAKVGEIPVTVRGRRRIEGHRESETFEVTYLVDIPRLKSLRTGRQ